MAIDVRLLSDEDLVKFIDTLVENRDSDFKILIASKEAKKRGILNRCKVDE